MDSKKSAVMQIRITPSERDKIRRYCSRMGIEFSAITRDLWLEMIRAKNYSIKSEMFGGKSAEQGGL